MPHRSKTGREKKGIKEKLLNRSGHINAFLFFFFFFHSIDAQMCGKTSYYSGLEKCKECCLWFIFRNPIIFIVT